MENKKDPTHPYTHYIGRRSPIVRTFPRAFFRGMVFAKKAGTPATYRKDQRR
jgi:hypothetical protein